eukprot:gene21666-28036_t
MTERLKEIVEEAVNKKKGPTTPGKGDALATNMYDDTADFDSNDMNASTMASTNSFLIPAPIPVKISSCRNLRPVDPFPI